MITPEDTKGRPLQPDDRAAIEGLAKETNSATEQVEKAYAETLERLSADARIRDFLTVLTIKNVRELLRKNRNPQGVSVGTHSPRRSL
jgi:hypothetical protein